MRYLTGLAALLAGLFAITRCGAQNVVPQIPANAQSQAHRGSWMLPEAKGSDLLYVAQGPSGVFVYTYPDVHLVGQLSGISRPYGLCSDSGGDVFVTEDVNKVLEFAHGGTSPINTLSPGGHACTWDPTTGNLAVVQFSPFTSSITIFPNVTEAPETYTDSGFSFIGCAYDDSGNLFLDGRPETSSSSPLVEFATKTGTFTTIALDGRVAGEGLQWDGRYIAMDDFPGAGPRVHRIEVSGSSGTIVSTVILGGAPLIYGYPSWIQGNRILAGIFAKHEDRTVELWSYPSGRGPTRRLRLHDFGANGPIRGLTLSAAPSASQPRR